MNARALPADDPLYDTKSAAAYLGISPSSLERYRLTGKPAIDFIKFPGRRGAVRYRKSVLEAFITSSVKTCTSDYGR